MILALDPGTEKTGWCVLKNGAVSGSGIDQNEQVLCMVRESAMRLQCDTLAIEMIASYGMPVGREVFETCVWIGRFQQVWSDPWSVKFVYRKDVKMHLCGTPRAKDANIRQALIDRFPRTGGGKIPQIGTKSQPGPLYGVTSHAWAALAVAVTADSDKRREAA